MAQLSTELKSLLEANKVPRRFQTFLETNGCTTVLAFESTAAKEELITDDLIVPSGIGDLTFGEKLAIKVSWKKARGETDPMPGSSSGPAVSRSKMPDGVEGPLRADWKAKHDFFLMGGWLVNEDTMA